MSTPQTKVRSQRVWCECPLPQELYRTISALESKLLENDRNRQRADDGEHAASSGRFVQGAGSSGASRDSASDESENELGFQASAVRLHIVRFLDALLIYLFRLAESIREMLVLTLALTVLAS